MTTANKVFELLSPIPEEDFITYSLTNGIDKCCARGHIIRLQSVNPNDYSIDNIINTNEHLDKEIWKKSIEFLNSKRPNEPIAAINNNPSDCYPQEKPKQRVMALLTDMIAAGY